MEPEPPEVAAARQDPRRQVGPYLVLRELGRGGMGVVVEAWDPRVGRRVALKRLLEQAGERARVRFEREARLGAGLEHPGIARLLDAAFEGPGAPYLVQELVRGKPLERLVDEDEPAPVRRAVELVASAARAIEHAHARGVVHRDLKPQNIMVRDDGTVCVLDLGLARGPAAGSVDVTATNQILGTPAYLAPEQITDARHAGPAADVYGLGGTLHALLTGAPPFTGPSGAILAMVRSTPADPPSMGRAGGPGELDAALDAIVLRALAKEPAKRFPSAAAFADALDGWLKATAGATPTPAPGSPRTVLAAAGGLVVGAALGSLATALALRQPPAPPTPTPTPPPVAAATEPPAPPPPPPPAPAEPAPAPTAPERPLPTLPVLSAAKKADLQRLLAEAGTLGKNKDFVGAEATCTQALAIGLTTQALGDRGYYRYRKKDYAGAIEDFELASRLEPEVALHLTNLGTNLLRAGRLAEAAAAFERSLALDPKDSTPYTGLAEIRGKQGDRVAGRAILERAVLALPDAVDLWAACGYSSFLLDDYARAIECYAKGAALAPGNDRMWANLSFNKAMAGDVRGALADAETAVRLDPKEPFNYRKRAYARALQGDVAGALADYERCVALDPSDAEARKGIAACKEELAKRGAAR